MNRCPRCGYELEDANLDARITDQELNVLSAWWHYRSVPTTARFFGVAEQTVKNQLNRARRRHRIHSTSELARIYMGELRSMEQLARSQNVAARHRGRAA